MKSKSYIPVNFTILDQENFINNEIKITHLSEPFNYNWNTELEQDDLVYSIYAVIVDIDNNRTTIPPISVTVNNQLPIDVTPPTGALTSPPAGSTVFGNASIQVTAADDQLVDYIEFYIDGALVGQYQPGANGETPWTQASFSVQPGEHTFTWSYIKDGGGGSTDMPEDCAWVDYITFPPSMIEDDGDGAMQGDVNQDNLISVLDVVLIINMVLESDFNSLGDLNEDGMVDVLDIILVVNLILES